MPGLASANVGTATIASFAGADRRAVSVTDSPGKSGSSYLLVCAAATVLLACLPALANSLPGRLPGDGWPIATVSGVLGLATIAGWLGAWTLSGRAWPAYVGLALVPGWVMAEIAGTPLSSMSRDSIATFIALLPPIVATAMLRRARRSPDVDTSLRPFRTLAVLIGATSALVVAVVLAIELAPDAPRAMVIVGGVASAAMWFAAAQICRRSRDLSAIDRKTLALALCAFGVAALDRTAGRLFSSDHVASWAFSCARGVVLLGWALLFVVAMRSVVGARRTSRSRQRELRAARDRIASGLAEQRRNIEERRHDLRSLIAGIQGATTTLTRYRGFLDVSEQHQLEAALLSEIGRLQHAISAGPAEEEPFALRAVVEPVITAERARGTVVNADLPDVEVIGNADATAALVQNLVTNVRRHAPGATVTVVAEAAPGAVRVVVTDDGPGLPDSVRQRVAILLADGDPAGGEVAIPRQAQPADAAEPICQDGHGLGLAICARLAREQGARLRLAQTTTGTSFELLLRSAVVVHATEAR